MGTVWVAQLREALGTASGAFVEISMARLLRACTLPGYASPTSASISAAIALIESLEPTNEAEATMSIHIAALDAATMLLVGRIPKAVTEERMKVSASGAAKLERAFQSAITNYFRFKRGNHQTIRIERLEIQAGAQAIVGQVSAVTPPTQRSR